MRRLFVRSTYLTRPHQLKTSSVILSAKPAPRAGPSSQPGDLAAGAKPAFPF